MFFLMFLTARPSKPSQSSLHPPLSWHWQIWQIGHVFIHSLFALQHVRVKLRLPIFFSQLCGDVILNLRRCCRRQRLQVAVTFLRLLIFFRLLD